MNENDRTFAKHSSVGKIGDKEDCKTVFAALKLIEQLYRDGLISACIYRNILADYADVVDLSQFVINESDTDRGVSKNV